MQLSWVGCILVLALSSLNYVLRLYRWQYFIAQLGRLPEGLLPPVKL